MKNTKVINIFGAPGAGKTCFMAGLFSYMKKNGYSCEMVTEYAKDLVYEHRKHTFTDELYIFAKQNHRLQRVNGQVDFIITDRPLPLSIIYAERTYGECSSSFYSIVKDTFNQYGNINFLLELPGSSNDYSQEGRFQDYSESMIIQNRFIAIMKELGIPYGIINRDSAYESVVHTIWYYTSTDSVSVYNTHERRR